MAPGWTHCPTISGTVPWPRPWERSSTSISLSFRRSSRRAASAVIEQRDGPTGIGHDDAWKGSRYQPAPIEPRVDAGVKVLTEMTIGRTDDPENPSQPVALEVA